MRRLITLTLLVGFSTILASSSAVADSGGKPDEKQSQEGTPPRASMIGYLKDEDLVDMCGCSFEHKTSMRGYTFAGDASGETAWMNIDGQDVKLKLKHSAGPKRVRRGSRYRETYEAEGVKVSLLLTVTRLCRPYGPDCETTGYNVIITVRKGERRQSVKARGQCGCV